MCCLCATVLPFCFICYYLFFILYHFIHSGRNEMETFLFFFRSPDSYHRSLICVQLSIYWQAGPRSSQADSYFTPTPAILIPHPWPLTHCHQAQSYEMDEVCLQEHKLSWFGGLFLSFKILKSFAFDHKWKPVVFSVLSELLASTNRSGGSRGLSLAWHHCSLDSAWVLGSEKAISHPSCKAVASDLPSLSQPTSPH